MRLLVVFPFNVEPRRPERGLLTLAAFAGYEVLYVRAGGKFCDATLDATSRAIACWWIGEVAATVMAFGARAYGPRWAY